MIQDMEIFMTAVGQMAKGTILDRQTVAEMLAQRDQALNAKDAALKAAEEKLAAAEQAIALKEAELTALRTDVAEQGTRIETLEHQIGILLEAPDSTPPAPAGVADTASDAAAST